jgi:predicted MFS family arabinose efflux permease
VAVGASHITHRGTVAAHAQRPTIGVASVPVGGRTGVTEASGAAPHRAGFAALLAITMASSTFAFTTFSVLSGDLLDAFGLRRWQLGALVTTAAIVGAVLSPPMGRISDRIGGHNALLMTLGLSATALAGIALSPVYALVMAAALTAGAAQSMANPATNKLISLHGVDGGRGALTGIKQSGVQVGVFLGGSLLPLGAQTIGWRPTLLVAALAPLMGLALSRRILPAAGSGRAPSGPDGVDRAELVRSPFLLQLATYGFLLGAGWSAVFTYLPDYGSNALGWDPTTAGLLVSAAGLCGIAGRIGWSWFAEHRSDAPRTLAILAAISIAAVGAILASAQVPVLLWLGAAALGGSSGSWNSVGMFAVIDRRPERAAGAASGIVMFGFLVGLGVGAPAFGWSVDVTGAYQVGLAAAAVTHVAGLGVALGLRHARLGAAVTAA